MSIDRYRAQREQFIRETAAHEMHVLHDDGLYRHLRFQQPGTSTWHFDLVTWPGSLAIRGDVGHGYIFHRDDDMLRWFDHHRAEHEINPHYWSEKLERGCADVREFSTDRFAAWCAEHAPSIDPADLDYDHQNGAIELLNAHGVTWDHEDVEMWEDYKHHFLLALYAILWGAKRFHEREGQAA